MPSAYSTVTKLSKPFWWVLWTVQDSPAISTRFMAAMHSLPLISQRAQPPDREKSRTAKWLSKAVYKDKFLC
jgi:hypothetical protein